MIIDQYDVKEGFYYSKEHEWVKIEDDKCRVGIGDYAQKQLHEVVYAELPKIGSKIKQKEPLGTLESIKAVADVYSPISGEIIKVNEELKNSPELINNNPYDNGWIAIIKPSKLGEEIETLMNAKKYSKFLEEQIKNGI